MSKVKGSGDGPASRGKAGQRLLVRSREGKDHPFLRGMVTHDLVQRGLSFNQAYSLASAIRGELAGRSSVTTTELQDRIDRHLEVLYPDLEGRLSLRSERQSNEIMISDSDSRSDRPFSRGLLARSLFASGLDFDRAYSRVTELEAEIREDGVEVVEREDLALRMADLLERSEGRATAARYRLMRRMRTLPRPLVIFLGGASGTGKSSLALELAPLLQINRVNSTDTIRQVMRMVFSPAILPAIHRSSFETDGPASPLTYVSRSSTPQDEASLIAGFDEQAMRVCVGVRAIVERYLAENQSLIVEGVHLLPGLVPFTDLEGAAYQLLFTMATLEEEEHRARFLARGQTESGRPSEKYLAHFGAIRQIHAHILRQAEVNEAPLLDTTSGETVVFRALRMITGVLQERVPWLAAPEPVAKKVGSRTLLLVLDGLPDRPVRALGGRTPLQVASLPTLDRLAAEGQCGLADPVGPGVVPDTAAGTLALLGQAPAALRRGPVEALGAGLDLVPGDIAFRANLATVDEQGRLVDRRAGRIRDGAAELARCLDGSRFRSAKGGEWVRVMVRNNTDHRLAVVLRGDGLSPNVTASDPGEGAPFGSPRQPAAIDPADEAAVRTATVLEKFEKKARRVLERHEVNLKRSLQGLQPANAVLTRGAGRIHRLEPLRAAGRSIRWAGIGADRTLHGLVRWLGGESLSLEGMTGGLDTDPGLKFKTALRALRKAELVVLHLKGADIAAHDRRPDLKVEFVEKVDRELGEFLEDWKGELTVVVASDHTTSSELGHHSADPVPVIVWGEGVKPDEVDRFTEQAAVEGSLERFPLSLLLPRILDGSL